MADYKDIMSSLDHALSHKFHQLTSLRLANAGECDSVLDDIQQIVRKLQEHQRSIREFRNTAVATSILPDDVLAHVFVFCASSDPCHTHLAFAHVCRYWRRVALDNPRIWSHIDFTFPGIALIMAERVKDAPLSLKADMNSIFQHGLQLKAAGVVTQKRATLESLHLTGGAFSMNPILAQMSGSMPCLTSLKLVKKDVRLTRGDSDLRCPALEGFACDRLRRLTLFGFTIPWTSRCFGNLTELRLVLDSSTHSPNVSQLLQAISKNPHLTLLQLTAWSKWNPSIHDNVSESTVMKHLSSLYLVAATPLLVHVLGSFVTPQLHSLHVQDFGVCNTRPEMASLITVICARYSAQFDIRKIAISESCVDGDIDVQVDVNVDVDVDEPQSHPVFLDEHDWNADGMTFAGTFCMTEDVLAWLGGNEIDSQPLQLRERIKNVSKCSILAPFSDEVWPAIRDHISSLPCPETLTITEEYTDLCLEVLKHPDWRPASTFPFPSLKVLCIVNANLDEEWVADDEDVISGMRILCDALKKWHEYRRKPLDVHLVSCSYKSGEDPLELAAEFGLDDWLKVE